MLSTVEIGGIDRIVVATTDRIARHKCDASAIEERITLAGARLVPAEEGHATDLYVNILSLFDSAFTGARLKERSVAGVPSALSAHPDPGPSVA
ncbi:hypothetical protein SPAN111604_05285 [Sphingomonas antarctica]